VYTFIDWGNVYGSVSQWDSFYKSLMLKLWLTSNVGLSLIRSHLGLPGTVFTMGE